MNAIQEDNRADTGRLTASEASALILGGGFAGLETAIGLSKQGLRVTLVSDRSEMFIYPTSIWMVTGEHHREDDVIDLDRAADQYGFTFRRGNVSTLDPTQRSVVVNGEKLTADFLILAMGAHRFQIPGMSHTHTVWGRPEDTEAVHEALEHLMERGGGRIALGFGGNPKDGSAVRGGPLFEVLFNIDHVLRKKKVRDAFELTFFAPMPKPGARMGNKAADAVKSMLDKIGVRQIVGTKIAKFDENGVVFEGERRLDADLTIFIPAGAGHAAIQGTNIPVNPAGFVTIDGQCRVPGFPGVFAVGDIAAVEGPDWRAKQGHLTVAMAGIAVRTIANSLKQRVSREDYREHVNIVCVMDTGNGAAFVKRTNKYARLIFLPIIGHLLKKAWGRWYRFTHTRLLPRLFLRRSRSLPVSP